MDLLRPDAHLTFEQIDRRFRYALTKASQAAGPKARRLMAEVLARKPSPNGIAESKAWYGDKLQAILELLNPMIVSLNNGMPGFSEWLDRTGYGNDLGMIKALVAWTDHSTGTVIEFRNMTTRMRHAARTMQ